MSDISDGAALLSEAKGLIVKLSSKLRHGSEKSTTGRPSYTELTKLYCSIVIPNIIPAVEPSESKPGEEKRVWRLAFFSRLEERKGLKMFVDAVNQLTANNRVPSDR